MNSLDDTVPVILEEPGQRSPAPGALRIVQQFVNTNDREGGHDLISSPQELAQWFSYWTQWPQSSTPTQEEHARALVVREGLRNLRHQLTVPDTELESAVQSLDIRLVVQDGLLRLGSPIRLGKALSPILDAVRAAMDDGSWKRIKICERDRCRWMYYDSSRNASSKWCSTKICGSREKARRSYQRMTATE